MPVLEVWNVDEHPNVIVHTTQVDFIDRDTLGPPVHLVQGDNRLPVIEVSLYYGGAEYKVPAGAYGNIRWKKPKPSPYYVYNPLLGLNEERTKAYVQVTEAMTTNDGPAPAVIEFIVDGDVGMSSYLPVFIDKNPVAPEGIRDTDEYKSLLDYVQNAHDYADAAEESKRQAGISEEKAKDSENAALASEKAAKASEDAAAASEAAAKKSEDSAAASADTAKQYSGHPNKVGDNGNWWAWNPDRQEFEDTGDRACLNYDITYPSIDAMEADAENQKPGTVAIISTDINVEDNAKTYIKRADGTWGFLADLSGFTGVGIKNIVWTSGNHAPGTMDVYTITLTDGREIPVSIYNGNDGQGVMTLNGKKGALEIVVKMHEVAVPHDIWKATESPKPTLGDLTAEWVAEIAAEGMTTEHEIMPGDIKFASGSMESYTQWRWIVPGEGVIYLYSDFKYTPEEDFTMYVKEVVLQ